MAKFKTASQITAEELIAAGLPPLDPDLQTSYVQAFKYAGSLFCGSAESIDELTEMPRARCRRGNPFPLVARQWPQIIVPLDHPEADIFRRDSAPQRFVGLPDEMQEAILDPANPLLRLGTVRF